MSFRRDKRDKQSERRMFHDDHIPDRQTYMGHTHTRSTCCHLITFVYEKRYIICDTKRWKKSAKVILSDKKKHLYRDFFNKRKKISFCIFRGCR